MYCVKLDSVNPEALKKGFTSLFKRGMPHFSIIRIDPDKSLNKLANNYFANKGILVLTRRSVHHMGFLEVGLFYTCNPKGDRYKRVLLIGDHSKCEKKIHKKHANG